MEKALANLRASINIMPYKFSLMLGLKELKPTQMTLQLADRSVRHPRGIVNDLLVKVGGFVFPADFLILDVNEDTEVPISLGCPFIATFNTLLDIQDWEDDISSW